MTPLPSPAAAPRQAVAPRQPMWRRVAFALAPLVGVVAFLGGWQTIVSAFSIEAYKLPGPWRVLRHLADNPVSYLDHARTTVWEAGIGFVLAIATALPVAMAMAHWRFVDRAVMPIAVLVQVTPIIAYVPAIVLWAGIGFRTIVLVTAIVCYVPFLVNLVAGLRSADPLLLELAHSVDASRWEVFTRLRLPSALPHLFAAARISVGLALIGAVIGEWFALTTRGLGYSLKLAQTQGTRGIDQVWGCIFVLAAIGAVATLALSVAERFVLHWHASQRQ